VEGASREPSGKVEWWVYPTKIISSGWGGVRVGAEKGKGSTECEPWCKGKKGKRLGSGHGRRAVKEPGENLPKRK